MKTLGIVLAFLAVASGHEWGDLRVTWRLKFLDPFHRNSFFKIPRTYEDAVRDNWVKVKGLNSLGLTTYCYPNDGQFCVLFDSYGHIAGFQAGILRQDVDPTGDIYKTSNFDVYSNKTIFEKFYVTTTVYTVPPETIKAGGRSDWQKLTGSEGLWFEKRNGYVKIARYASDLDSLWIKEGCINGMGTHYYYNIHPTSECKDFFPMFLLYEDGELTGMGLQAFGSCTVKNRNWCEYIPTSVIKPTIPTSPQCLTDWANKYGVISIHIFFTLNPWDFSCS